MFQKDVFGERLKGLRLWAGETQDQLAAVLGVGKSHISEMENGKKTTTAEKLVLLCEHYHVSADYLLGLAEEPRNAGD